MNIKLKWSLKILLLVFYIYPIVPLGFLAAWALIMGSFSVVSRPEMLTGVNILYIGLFFLWFLGGVVGLYAGLKALQNQNTKTVFWLFVFATISYSVVAIRYVYEGFVHSLARLFTEGRMTTSDSLNLIHSIYILLSLVVIGRQLVVIYRDAYRSSPQQSKPTPYIENAH